MLFWQAGDIGEWGGHSDTKCAEEEKRAFFAAEASRVALAALAGKARGEGEKEQAKRNVTEGLRFWICHCRKTPYPTTEEIGMIAHALHITVPQVRNFCNNFRKRFTQSRVEGGHTLTSYKAHGGLVGAHAGCD